MKDALQWVFGVVVAGLFSFLLTASLRFLLPVISENPTYSIIEILFFFSALLWSLGLGIATQGRRERSALLQQALDRSRLEIEQTVKSTFDNSLLALLFQSLRSEPAKKNLTRVLDKLARQLSSKSDLAADVSSIFVEAEFASLLDKIDKLFGEGVQTDIANHIRITRYLCASSQSYLQIQRRAFRVPEEWTTDWCIFLDEIGKNFTLSKKYIVLTSSKEIREDYLKLENMETYLKLRNIEFYVAETEVVTDSIGELPTSRVVELFGTDLIKSAETPEKKYRGGIRLTMSIHETAKRNDLVDYIKAVELASKRLREYSRMTE